MTQHHHAPAPPHQPAVADVLRQLHGAFITQMIAVAAQLGIADQLQDGPRHSQDLAAAVGAHPVALSQLLRALAGRGIFAEHADGSFALTPLAALLRSGVPGSLRAYACLQGEPWWWRACGALLASVRTNQPAFASVHGAPVFAYVAQHPTAATAFQAAMADLTSLEAPAIVAACDFAGLETIVDVGGGQGALLSAILHGAASTALWLALGHSVSVGDKAVPRIP